MDKTEAIKRIKDHIRVHHIGEYPHILIAEALDMAISALETNINVGDKVEVVRCKDCEYTCPGTSGIVCTMWGAGTEPDGWCYKAERKNNGKTSL